ncbi:MAG: putative lipid II flippase FtsW [Patescibacteria group bacterium]
MTTAFRRADSVYLSLTFALCTVGIILLASASSVESYQTYGDPNSMLVKQAIALLMGLGAMFILMGYDYHRLQKWSKLLLIFSFVLLLLPLIPGIGTELLGARRWISIGGFFFQPSEAVKLALIVYLAAWFPKIRLDREEAKQTFLPFVAILAFITIALVLQPDLGTAIVIIGTAVVMYFVAGAPAKLFAWIGIGVITGVLLLIQLSPYRAARLTVFLNPEGDAQGTGYHINQSLLAIGSGGLFGRGYGQSLQKYNYLPEAAGDSIFAVAAEELGFFLTVGLIALYVALFWRGVRLARSAADPTGQLIVVGITSWFIIQAFVNIGALTSLLPLTGEPLPFISNGGTSLIFSLAAAGVLLNISKSARQ